MRFPIPPHPILCVRRLQPTFTQATYTEMAEAVYDAVWETIFAIHFKVSGNPLKKQTNKTKKPTYQKKLKTKQKHHNKKTNMSANGICSVAAAGHQHQRRDSNLCLLSAASVNSLNILKDDFKMILAFFPPQSVWKFPLHKPIEVLLKNGYAKDIWKMTNHYCFSLLELSSLPDTYSLCIWRFFSTLHTLILNSAFKQKFEQQPRR